MRRLIAPACCILLVALAPKAIAQYITLAIDDCLVGGGLITASTNCPPATSSTHWLVYTIQLPFDQPQFVAVEVVIDMVDDTRANDMGDWWQWDGTGCRTGSVVSGQPEASAAPNWSAACVDVGLWATSAISLGGIVKRPSPAAGMGPNSQHIRFQWVVPAANAISLTAGVQYAVGALRIQSLDGTGHASCTGCGNGVKFTLSSIGSYQIAGAPGGDVILRTPLPRPGYGWFFPNCVTFNEYWGNCASWVPTQSHTWGQLKSLYR